MKYTAQMTILNESQIKILRSAFCPPARLVVAGPSKSGKYDAVREQMMEITSEHDMLEVDGSINGARQAQHFVKTLPIVGEIRSVLVNGKNFSEPAQDAYLKICEETHDSSLIVMVVDDDGLLRPALKSRLNVIRLRFSEEDVSGFMQRSGVPFDSFVVSASHGRVGLCKPISSNLDEMKHLFSCVCDVIDDKPDMVRVPQVFLNWTKLDDDTKDAVLSVCEFAIRSKQGSRSHLISSFVETISSFPSANAEIYWWRTCLA